MKKILLLSLIVFAFAFAGFSQRGDPNTFTVTNVSTTCTYSVCLHMGIRQIGTTTILSDTWQCFTMAPGTSATYSMMVSPASGYEIVVIEGTAAYDGVNYVAFDVPADGWNQSCVPGRWTTFYNTGARSYNIGDSVVSGG